ncbi:MAG: rhodanese-like domain-containing protein [Bacteroidia bacterium]
MLKSLKSIFGITSKTNYKDLVKNGAKIIDVRTRKEFASGHIKGSINFPLNELKDHVRILKEDSVLITCCASGLRSASAKSVLKSLGYNHVYNGGGWLLLENQIK